MIHLRLTRAVHMGAKSLALHPLRSVLTALSTTVAVGAVIAMLAIGEGASFRAQQQFRALGSNTIMLESVKPAVQKDNAPQTFSITYGLTYDDLERIRQTVPDVELSVPVRDLRKEIWYLDRRYADGRIVGTSYWFADVQNYKLADGRWITALDNEPGHVNKVAVLGSSVAKQLFPMEDPVGRNILIASVTFKVVGVMASQEGGEGRAKLNLADLSKNLYVPLRTLTTYFGPLDVSRVSGNQTAETVELRQIICRVKNLEQVIPRAEALRRLLDRFHPQQDYRLIVPLKEIRQAQESAKMYKFFLASIGGISLFVGGIGIMNIMLATVTERTREIGIRRALGARRLHIIMQFLVETAVLACIGGLVGVLFGLFMPWIVPKLFPDQIAIISAFAVVISFAISVGVGIVFGLYPAWRAARMDPIEALRHE